MDSNTVKSDAGGKIVGVFTITEMSYLMVSLLWDCLQPLSYVFLQC